MATKALPKTLAACADELYELREARYALQKQVDEMKKHETLLKDQIINNLSKSEATGVAGKVAKVAIKTGTAYSVTDWDAVHDYILKHVKKDPGVWAIMQKRVSDSAIKDMVEAGGKPPPGVERVTTVDISLTKV